MGTYNTNNGRYQERADYYSNIDAVNVYGHLYQNVVIIYNLFYTHSVLSLDWREILYQIRDMRGLGRSWGYALKVIDLVDNKKSEEAIASSLESLMNSLLEVLPAYVPWVPVAKIVSNQPLLDYLQDRGNEYRMIGNPKFYAYDRVVNSIAVTTIPVSGSNCVYINGVGPRITQHIRDFLNKPTQPDDTSIPVSESPKPELRTSLMDADEPELSINFIGELPAVKLEENVQVARYLWNSAHRQTCRTLAWRRAAVTICNSNHIVEDLVDILGTETTRTQLPYIGEIMGDVIREFYQYENIVETNPEHLVECPVSITRDCITRHYQQILIDLLWNYGYFETAHEISCTDIVPQTRADFKILNTCTSQLIQTIYADTKTGAPVADNWINQRLTDWLWDTGYTNASRAVARKKNIVINENLQAVQFIGPHIAEQAAVQVFGVEHTV